MNKELYKVGDVISFKSHGMERIGIICDVEIVTNQHRHLYTVIVCGVSGNYRRFLYGNIITGVYT